MLYKKPGQNPARSNSVMGRSSQIPTSSSEIKPDLAKSQQISAFFFFFAESGDFFHIPANFCRFRRLSPPTDHHPNSKLTWLIDVGNRFLVPSPSNRCQWVGSKNQTDATCGQTSSLHMNYWSKILKVLTFFVSLDHKVLQSFIFVSTLVNLHPT